MAHQIEWPSWPNYSQRHEEAVLEVIRSNQIFAKTKVREFETRFALFLGGGNAVGVSNATTGLHLALAALGIGKGDEVIVTPYSWISSASSILMQNAVPVFADIESSTFGLDPREIESKISDKTKAVICVHMFGIPCRIDQIVEICKGRGLSIIEDASHAHGALHKEKAIGTFGDVSVFSLHQRKNLSVGEGGIVFSKDFKLSEKIRRLRSFGDDELSYNYRMTEFAGALGTVGLETIGKENELRNRNAKILEEGLQGDSIFRIVSPYENDFGVFHAALLKVVKEPAGGIELLLRYLQNCGVPIKKTWNPLHTHPHFNPKISPPRGAPWQDKEYNGQMSGKSYANLNLPVTEEYVPNKLLELPIHPPAGEREMAFFLDALKEFSLI